MILTDKGFFKYFNKKIEEVINYDGLVLNWSAYKQKFDFKGQKYAVYNTEVLKYKLNDDYKQFLDRAEVVFDYSEINVRDFYPKAEFKPILVNENNIVKSEGEKKFDILFYGFLTERRMNILNNLEASNLRVCRLSGGVFGDKLQNIVNKSKYVLSLGTYDCENNDAARVVPAIEMGAKVITEKCGEDWFNNHITKYGSYVVETSEIINKCLELCK